MFNDPICLISKFINNLATQLATCGQRESWAARLWANSGIKKGGKNSLNHNVALFPMLISQILKNCTKKCNAFPPETEISKTELEK